MKTSTEAKISLEKLSYLPSFAQYILQHRLDDLVKLQLLYAKDMRIPVMEYLKDMSEEKLFEFAKQGAKEFLNYLACNKAKQQIEDSLKNWLSDQLPLIRKNEIVAEDITGITYLRKKSFMHFVVGYCTDTEQVIELVKEMDLFFMESETAATNTFINLLKEDISEHAHMIEKITNTSPGIIYVYDVENNKELYANKTTTEFLGFTPEEITKMGDDFVPKLIHPDDLERLKYYEKDFLNAKDGETRSFKYRIRNKNGDYRWLRTYETVFKRNANGKVSQKIGIAIDVHEQKLIADALQKREQELLEAQEIAQLGSFTWNFEDGRSSGSPQTKEILGIDFSNHEAFMANVHPDDKEKVEEALELSYKSGAYECEYRYIANGKEKTIWAKGLVSYKRGKPIGMTGTIMDITEKAGILHQLRENEKLFKQAEAITHIGSYIWDVKTYTLSWSDELYRIYGLTPGEKITFDYISSFNNPEDTPEVRKAYSQAIAEKKPFDFYYRITSKDGTRKIIHARGNMVVNYSGEVDTIVGTAQDVTEKQTLIRELTEKEALYKQAEELANMGNWKWDVQRNRLDWTDQLYRIYGLEPGSEKITLERFLSYVHPDDRERVSKIVDEAQIKGRLDYTFKIITPDNTTKILRSVAQVNRNEKGEALYVIGTERDITEKQTLIDKLQRSESLYKQAQALAHLGNWSWDIRTNTIQWSDELYRIYGLKPQSQSLSYEEYLSLIHPEDKEKVTSQVQHAMNTGESWEYTHRLVRKNGEVRIVSATGEVLTDDHGKPVMMIGTAQDITERQLLIDRLQESEKLSKQAQSLAHLGNWTWNLKTYEFEWSDEMYNIFEIPKNKKLTYDEWFEYVHPDDREAVRNYINECIEEGKIYDKTHRIVLPSGKVKTIHRKGELICDESGKPVKMIGTTQDITEEYRIQQELRENQTFIRKITDATPSIIASYNINTGKYVFISEGLEKLLGYDVKEVLEKGIEFFAHIIHPDDAVEIMEKNAAVLAEANADADKNDLVAEFTYRMKHKNGEYRWFHTYGTIFDRNQQGKVEHVLNISLDVTEQIEASQKIKDQEHFIQQIADASPTILYLYDVKTQSMAYINREIFFVLGYSPDEVIDWGDDITENLYHPEDYYLLPGRKQSGKNFQQADSMIQYECRMKNREGEFRWLLVREIVFKQDEQGDIIQILGAALDINRRKEMEKTILQNTLLLEQSNSSLEEFAYVASHDLKEPLRKISTFGDRLVATQLDKLSEDGKIYLQKIVDASQRMQTMISDLLSISMISNNTSFERHSLQKILEETLQTLEYKVDQQDALINSDPLPEARIIPSQFRQLFQNLLSNSLKFVRPGVQPVIDIKYSLLNHNETLHYQLAQANQYHKIEFADNGIGFENEYAGKIFAIFQRLHGRSEYEGSGIGLAICKKIVEHHGGAIYARGVPGQGATFIIILPA